MKNALSNVTILLRYIYLSVFLLFCSCKEEFIPTYTVEDSVPTLVVEGLINASDIRSYYQLGFTRKIDSQYYKENANSEISKNQPATGAVLFLESKLGEVFRATEVVQNPGKYVIEHGNLNLLDEYRIRINLNSNSYVSDFVTVKQSPPIGEVVWERSEDGIRFFVSTEDIESKSHYYKWDLEETWLYTSEYLSTVYYYDKQILVRNSDQMIHECFMTTLSPLINIASSIEMEADKVSKHQVNYIPNGSEKLGNRYSILIKQHVLSEDAFKYWSTFKKNSTQIGDFFGPMPANVFGNIRNVDKPNDLIIGLIEASTVSTKRVSYRRSDFGTPWWSVDRNIVGTNCGLLEYTTDQATKFLDTRPNYLLVVGIGSPFITHYSIAPEECVDCRLRGGTLKSPDYWGN